MSAAGRPSEAPGLRIGCISDTHGLLDPRVFAALSGVDRILHAGDIGDESLLVELEAIAPVLAVRGNVDGMGLPEWIVEEIGGARIGVTHIALESEGRLHAHVAERVEGERLDILLFGHTHVAWRGRHAWGAGARPGATLLFNPGSAGRPRFRLAPSVGMVTVRAAGGARDITAEIVPL